MRYKIFLFVLISGFFTLFFPKNISAAPYPIKELGNCSDQTSCYLYCATAAHTPACWAYHMQQTQILGDEISLTITPEPTITFPVPQLGGCTDKTSCKLYCEDPTHRTECITFSQNHRRKNQKVASPSSSFKQETIDALKTELGCTDQHSCFLACSKPEMKGACHVFAQKHNLTKDTPVSPMIQAAKKELGCTDQTSCAALCQNPSQKKACQTFSSAHQMLLPPSIRPLQKEKMISLAKEKLGCTTPEECKAYCSDPAHIDACASLLKEITPSISPPLPVSISLPPNIENQEPRTGALPCTEDASCKIYCQQHPDQCPQFTSSFSGMIKKGEKVPTGSFLGPGGCTTSEECRQYCIQHPSECPGFSSVKDTRNIQGRKPPLPSGERGTPPIIRRESPKPPISPMPDLHTTETPTQ